MVLLQQLTKLLDRTPVAPAFPCIHAAATTPAQRLNVSLRSFHPDVSVFPNRLVGSTCALSFSRIARRSLALQPAHSRCHQSCDTLIEGFSHFVTSMTAPIACGWSGCRVGLAPTGKRRLCTAHTHLGHLAGSKSEADQCDCPTSSAAPYWVIDTPILLTVGAIASIEACDASVVSF